MTCPQCQQGAPFHGYRPLHPVSLLGQITCRRAYYYCGRCGLGLFPFDEQAGFNEHRLTAGAQRVVSLLGQICDSFEEAATKTLPEACGLHLGESTVQHTTEDAGKRLGELLQQGHTLGEPKAFAWHKDALGRTCAYVSIDATGVPQQAKEGGKAENRMAYVAMVYNPPPEKDKPVQTGQPAGPAVGLPVPGCQPVPETVGVADALPGQPSVGLPVPGYQPVPETVGVADALPGLSRLSQANRPLACRCRAYQPVPETVGAADALPGQPHGRQPKPVKMEARYLSGLYDLDELGLQLRQQAAQVGMEQSRAMARLIRCRQRHGRFPAT